MKLEEKEADLFLCHVFVLAVLAELVDCNGDDPVCRPSGDFLCVLFPLARKGKNHQLIFDMSHSYWLQDSIELNLDGCHINCLHWMSVYIINCSDSLYQFPYG